MNNYDLDALEREELETSCPEESFYVKLFACYLLQNKLYDAKFLWKRISWELKVEGSEPWQLNLLLNSLISNNILDFLKNIKWEWSKEIQPIMDDLLNTAQENVFSTVKNAYSSIVEENLIEAMDAYEKTPAQNDKKLATQNNCLREAKAAAAGSSQYQMSRLTGFVSFLEN